MVKNSTKWIFTTSHKPNKKQIEKALQLANKYGGVYLERNKLRMDEGNFYFVIDKKLALNFQWEDGKLFFHPSVSKIRLNNYLKNGIDHLINAVSPQKNDIILDLTLGLGSDALLLSHFCKKIVGLEASFPIYAVVVENITNYDYKENWMKEASKKIEVINSDYKIFLNEQKEESYDVIYCDPMFENPQYKSSSINPLRKFARYDKITQEDLEKMVKIARKKVVIKARSNDSVWDLYDFDKKIGSKKSGVFFGVIEK
ncbi:class I SAM-dependent methyltransferase [Petrotoga halophila]|uniref:Methyltransferase n=1 Tax=Petrotoga halophila DSM 16923 TaxID=1122953 RepID=A0A2S5EGD4_9BACT|nr:class I SAM-dependent methyltransferase [Petrotoga halophila]POZ92203.1 methyltransferase [Petrotoga halophila DSM 16923]